MKLTEEACFETETGTPTLTIVLPNEQRMISYCGFRDAVMNGKSITIRFHDWTICIEGKSLDPLWEQFQMQDVRVLRLSREQVEAECRIKRITLEEGELN